MIILIEVVGFFNLQTCFFRQFGRSVVRADYLTLRNGFITYCCFYEYLLIMFFLSMQNHNLTPKYDFHSYMIRSMEEEFQRIVGVSGPLWGFVVAFMLFNVKDLPDSFSVVTAPYLSTQLVTQMGTNYKAALIPQRIRETIHGWGKEARRKRRHGLFTDDSTTIHTDASTVMSLEEDEHQLIDIPETADHTVTDIELQPSNVTSPSPVANETSSRAATPLLRPSATISSSTLPLSFQTEGIPRSSSMPVRRE
ncbi:hypothetical protein EZV62_002329 [Acer yangbiense]|uniref:MLO-like protein n=1 Tax=Acer yangbiense TaxID=1000413 RepID=A0A5C7IWS9_9ROSI|nr:hypothetical protein EZV62_002329 [Acer yangbiense]